MRFDPYELKTMFPWISTVTPHGFETEANTPKPGTYDPSWKPPTHQVWTVEIQADGLWQVKLGGVRMTEGEGAKRSRQEAKEIIENHCKGFLQ